MAYNSDEEEMFPEGLVEVAHAIVGFHVPGIYVSAPGRRTNSYTEYGFIEVKRAERREEKRPILQFQTESE